MNMWAVSDLPVYAVDRDSSRRKSGKRSKYSLGRSRSNQSSTVALLPGPADTFRQDSDSIRGLLEPAIEGPPSPSSIRALSNQMKQSSAQDKHQSHQTTSSGSSSLRSLASADRPSWENALEGLSLSRKSSGRSTVGSMPPRDRPESVQIFSKSIFNRRGKLRRESSTQSSSASSSIYSGETGSDAMLPPPPTSVPMRDSVIPSLFGRRRATSKLENVDEASAQRKFQISGPYNFQHVTHTQRDSVVDSQQQTGRAASDFSQIRASQIPGPRSAGTNTDDMHFADFSSDSLPLHADNDLGLASEPHTRINLSRPPSLVPKQFSPPRRLLKHTRSQEQLRVAPPRPPRSPIDLSFTLSPPVPPPRISSRTSMRPDGLDAAFDRPQTSSGFRHPQPFSLSPDATSPPATSHGYFPGPDMGTIPEHAHSRAPSFSDDSNWPLPCPTSLSSDALLPNVPEEDESIALFRKSRASVASNSSLRGSQSVPMLKMLSTRQDEMPRRPTSNASDTLGRFDLLAAQRALEAAFLDGMDESLPRECWEDDIDYCYEHAAEADCDYAWDRPSLDMSRDGDTPVEDHFRTVESCDASPSMLTPAQFDLPALSPVSQMSTASAHEAITPTLTVPKASNFSLPRSEGTSMKHLLHARRPSDASSFKESHGFTLSPSLLIPNDYQQQMMAAEADARDFAFHQFEEPSLTLDTAALQTQYRTSASTTGTAESTHSGFEKHTSAASSSTDVSGLALSTSSLDTDNYLPKAEPVQQFPVFETHSRVESKSTMPTLRESEEMGSEPSLYRQDFASRSSESNLVRMAAAADGRKDSIHIRRARARTTSLSTPPPTNQYALFPRHIVGSGRI